MSAISISGNIGIGAVAPGTAPRATRLRITRRGRRVLVSLASLPVAIALCVAVLAGGSALASHGGSAPAESFATVVVAPGQSLWSIAEEVAPTADPRDVVDAIVSLNALDGVTVNPGERLAIPTEYAPSH